MTPMHHEHQRPDRTNHRREVESRRADQRGPTPDQIDRALSNLADHDVPGTPPVSTLRTLQAVHDSEWAVKDRELKDFSITSGRPRHGALRSDDHISSYEIEVSIRGVSGDTCPRAKCPDCGNRRATYKYNAHHHIAGSESLVCTQCEKTLYHDEWG